MPKKGKTHLTEEERYEIRTQHENGISKRGIACKLGRSHSTIIRELKRNKGLRSYRAKQAHSFACERRSKASSKPRKMTALVKKLIREMLTSHQSSPAQISGRLAREHKIIISVETIYRFILDDKASGGTLYLHLRRRCKKYNKRAGKTAGRGLIPNRVDIDKRPEIVNLKQRFGDFELDTIVGANHKGAIVSIVDRASKYTYLRLVERATAKDVTQAISKALKSLGNKNLIETFTADNGKEFAYHQIITRKLGGEFYFAKPYHSWERGLNEHTNGLVRQYFPKGTDFTKISHRRVKKVETILNNRPRKILNFMTPNEVFLHLTSKTTSGAFQS